ncbi:DUF418 domain-containing protein [Lentiprolixibacter aurantiacus]|uniref:DUF418 domain-containing protein n=1 Tax=Lentiprolixibacter aurantiacus TaxID=2993939 RepID=A0AAE3MKN1_9FLAO|nr:DUF418 domain-containing protein [Lentiprolixibacter aurantiacus]MCX2719560.1 DUF418 domain-containing protein [Lentiprolixibacter aurantiacus]
MNITTTNKGRIQIVDALRGFSLAGIVIVHLVENYIAAPSPEGALDATHTGIPDYVVDGIIGIFFRGKFFALFSFLFGLSFFIQMDRARDKGQDYRWRFLWRLLLLFVIGFVHHMFYRGDILTIYALLGVFLIPFYKVRTPWVLAIAALLFLGLGRFAVFLFTRGDNLFMPGAFDPNTPEIASYFELLKSGGLNEVMHSNATEGQIMKMDFQFGIFSRGYLTLAFFLLGLYAGRIRFFENFEERWSFMQNILYGSIGVLVVGLGVTVLGFAQMGPIVTFDNWMAMIGLTGMDLVNLALALMLIALFVYLYKKIRWQPWLQSFAPYGRMALTNYVFQSILGTFFFYGWGLGYLATIPNRYTFLMAFGVIAFQMWISNLWLKHFQYGPLEWIWRSLTHFKYYPLRRS